MALNVLQLTSSGTSLGLTRSHNQSMQLFIYEPPFSHALSQQRCHLLMTSR